MPERCQAITKSGNPCGATVVADGMCAWHSPSWAERRRQWSAKGGRERSNGARAKKKIAGDLRDLAGVKAMLLESMQATKDGEMEPGVLTALSTAARAVVAVAGVADFEAQLSEMRRELSGLTDDRGA